MENKKMFETTNQLGNGLSRTNHAPITALLELLDGY